MECGEIRESDTAWFASDLSVTGPNSHEFGATFCCVLDFSLFSIEFPTKARHIVESCSRRILKRTLSKANEMGI